MRNKYENFPATWTLSELPLVPPETNYYDRGDQ